MLLCPRCRTAYPPGTPMCLRDGSALKDARELRQQGGDPLIGQWIADRYEVVARLGIGGMGTVYRARQRGLVREVALKILKREVSNNPEAVARFQREAKAMSLLQHPNTVRVFDFGQTSDGLLYLAMELLEGETLGDRLEREGVLEPEQAIDVAVQVLASLHEAHSKGLVHRDLKPDNVFLSRVEGHEGPVVKVLDFGIAKAWQGEARLDGLETQAGTVFGTPRYMSPEQAQGLALDPRSDLYSVGVLLYHMLTGTPPFDDENAVVVMAKHIRERPLPVRRAAPDQPIPASLERVVMRALEKDPALRFQDAQQFSEALRRTLPDVERERRLRHRWTGRLWALRYRVPRTARALVAGALVGALGVGGYALSQRHAAPETSSHRGAAHQRKERSDSRRGAANAGRRAVRGVLRTEPPGAAVYRNGQRVGTTPFQYELPVGERMEVELRREGYRPQRTQLVGGENERTVVLAPEPATARATESSRTRGTEARRPRVRQRRSSGRTRSRFRGRPSAQRAVKTAGSGLQHPAAHSSRRPMDEPYEFFEE